MRRLAFPIHHGVERLMGRIGVFFANLTVHSKLSILHQSLAPDRAFSVGTNW
jgi:hypothetical protein